MKAKIILPIQLVRVVVCGLGLLITTVALPTAVTADPPLKGKNSRNVEHVLLNHRSEAATEFARNFLISYNNPAASVDGKPVTSAGLSQVYAGDTAAQLFGVPKSDPRVPDVVGIAQYGVVYTGHKGKIAEHGGDHTEDRNVPILLVLPDLSLGTAVTTPVETTQIAPTILKLLSLNPKELEAVRAEGTDSLF